MESFYSRHAGSVLNATINKFTYVSSHFFFDIDKIRVKYSKTETHATVGEIEHPIVREVLRKFEIKGAIEISSNGDVVSGSGLGSSSAFTVAMLLNMHTRAGHYVSKALLAEEACEIEIEKLAEPIGKQDQYASAFGGLNQTHFPTSGRPLVEPVHLEQAIYKELERNLLMFYTGISRTTASILTEQRGNMSQADKVDFLRRMVDLVPIAREVAALGHAAALRRAAQHDMGTEVQAGLWDQQHRDRTALPTGNRRGGRGGQIARRRWGRLSALLLRAGPPG